MATGTPLLRPSANMGTSLVVMDDCSVVQRLVDPQTVLRRGFSLGVGSLVRHCFRHEPPRPIELEHAIELTEDAVMPVAARFASDTHLVLQGLGAVLIARGLHVVGLTQTSLKLEEVESMFNRLVAISEGRPANQEFLPTDASFFAAMVILREFMHHLHFANVTIQSPGEQE